MKDAVIYLKTDTELKNQAQQKAKGLGLSLSAIINLQLREFVNGRDIRIQVDSPDDQLPSTTPQPPVMLA